MLVFIVPLKNRQISKSWDRVSQLFERTAKSICNQTSDQFRLLVVCNERPDTTFNHPNLIYCPVDFPPPGESWREREMDRTRRVLRGLVEARAWNPSHVMVCDADDCVSRHLSEFVAHNPEEAGWFIKRGYFYYEGSSWIKLMRKGFNQYCGSSNIVRYDLYELPEIINEAEQIDRLFNYYRHRDLQSTLIQKQVMLKPLPFAGAVYVQHGNNSYFGTRDRNRKLSLKTRLLRLKAILDHRRLSFSVQDEFGLVKLMPLGMGIK